MKNILIFSFIFILNNSYSQVATIDFASPATYSFVHEKLMDEARVERYTARMLSECIELESITFNGNSCRVVMKNALSTEDIEKALNYCINKFGFLSYNITEQ